jgi:hypothetical protein
MSTEPTYLINEVQTKKECPQGLKPDFFGAPNVGAEAPAPFPFPNPRFGPASVKYGMSLLLAVD